jgi:hypothetical protein
MTVVMKSSVFWGVMMCSSLKSTNVSKEHVASIFKDEE